MTATVIIEEHNGAGNTRTDKTSGTVRFKNADNATVDLNNPLVVPSAGARENSYEKWLRLRITNGAFTQISNLRAYSDGDLSFGQGSPSEVNVYYATAGAYRAPAVPTEVNGPPQIPEAGSPVENMTNLALRVSGDPVDMDAINTGPFTDGSPAEEIGDFLVLVMQLMPGASSGLLTAETLTFAYDEI